MYSRLIFTISSAGRKNQFFIRVPRYGLALGGGATLVEAHRHVRKGRSRSRIAWLPRGTVLYTNGLDTGFGAYGFHLAIGQRGNR